MGTGSMERSEISSDFLCLRLQRLRTSSDTVSSAAPNKRGLRSKDEADLTQPGNGPEMRSEFVNQTLNLNTGNIFPPFPCSAAVFIHSDGFGVSCLTVHTRSIRR